LIEYSYTVKSLPESQQDVWNFMIIFNFSPDLISKKFLIPGWWKPDIPNKKPFWISWSAPENKDINPGDSLNGFGLVADSLLLPGITDFYAEGDHPIPSFEEGMAPNFIPGYDDLTPYGPGIVGKTVGPVLPPDPFLPETFLDTLISYTTQSHTLNWISDSTTTAKYTDYFENTKSHIQQNNNPAAINVLDSVLTDVEADSGVTLTSEAYALIKYNTEYLKEQLTQPHGLPHNVRLLNSQGQLLTGGSLQYYDGGWKTAVNNGDGTFLVEIERSTVSLRMSYEGGNETRQNVPIQGAVVTFQTVNSKIELRNSQNQLIDEGTVQYYAGGWRDFGLTSGGVASKELLPLQYSFRMTYAHAGIDKQQNIGQDSAVVFQTVAARVELRNSTDNLIDQGSVQYYAGAWREFGTTSGGIATKELLPKQYSFRMSYAYASIDKQQDIGSDPTIVFQTVNAQVELRNSTGNLIDEGSVQYYAGAWREFGTTSGGVASMELLPKQYSFRMTYAYASIDKQQDIGNNPIVSFATVLATINVTGQQNQPLNGAQVSYYSGAWRSIGETVNGSITKELLPRNYTFRAAYQGTSADLQEDISQNSTVNIQLNITGP